MQSKSNCDDNLDGTPSALGSAGSFWAKDCVEFLLLTKVLLVDKLFAESRPNKSNAAGDFAVVGIWTFADILLLEEPCPFSLKYNLKGMEYL